MDRGTTYADQPMAGGLTPAKRISWSAVFAGVLVAVVTQMLLTLLGIGVGLGSLDTVEERNPAAGLGIGTAIWYIVSSLLSLFAGGWVAGRLASTPRLFDGVIHGVLMWSLVILFTVYLLTTAVGRIIGGVSSLVSGIVSKAGSGIAAAAPGLADQAQDQLRKNGVDLDLSDLKGEVNQLLRETGKPGLRPQALENQAERAGDQAQNAASRAASNPQGAGETADGVIDQFIKRGEGVADQIDRTAAVNVVMKRTGKSRAESEQVVDNWTKTYQQARVKFEQTKKEAEVKARQIADDVASAASKEGIFGFFGLLIGVAAAGYGAKAGTDSKDDYNRLDRPVGEVR